jgi:hypothetical protein
MNSKCILFVSILMLNLSNVSSANEVSTNNSVVAEVEIQTAGQIARVSVYLLNASKTNQTLFTGRVGTHQRGTYHSVDFDEVAKNRPSGNGALATPELTFGAIKFSAPTTVDWGATFRNMLPTLLRLDEGERALYCVFSVPTVYIRSEFAGGRIRFPDLRDVPSVDVPISKCIRKGEEAKSKEQGKKLSR